MVQGGYRRQNDPDLRMSKKEKDKDHVTVETVDWSVEISNEQLRYITGTLPIRDVLCQSIPKIPGSCL